MAYPESLQADKWVEQLFYSKAAANGGVVRRKRTDIELIIGWPRFQWELDRRGFRAIENAGQIVIFCNHDPVLTIR